MSAVVIVVLGAAILGYLALARVRAHRRERADDLRWFTEEQMWWAQLHATAAPSAELPGTPRAVVGQGPLGSRCARARVQQARSAAGPRSALAHPQKTRTAGPHLR